jgi:hypothetical protein
VPPVLLLAPVITSVPVPRFRKAARFNGDAAIPGKGEIYEWIGG